MTVLTDGLVSQDTSKSQSLLLHEEEENSSCVEQDGVVMGDFAGTRCCIWCRRSSEQRNKELVQS